MKAIKKHGPNYKLIEEAVKSRSFGVIKSRIVRLLKDIKMNKHHPDRDILREFAKKRTTKTKWKHKEIDVLMRAANKFGKDYKMISNAVQTKTVDQIRGKVFQMHSRTASNPKHEHAKYAKVLNKLPLIVSCKWTDRQKKRFSEAVQKHGRDCRAIMKYFPKMSHTQIKSRIFSLKK